MQEGKDKAQMSLKVKLSNGCLNGGVEADDFYSFLLSSQPTSFAFSLTTISRTNKTRCTVTGTQGLPAIISGVPAVTQKIPTWGYSLMC